MVEIRNITKDYGRIKAIDDINFNVGKGKILGFLSPNGAGKLTTINILTGFISSTSGKQSTNFNIYILILSIDFIEIK